MVGEDRPWRNGFTQRAQRSKARCDRCFAANVACNKGLVQRIRAFVAITVFIKKEMVGEDTNHGAKTVATVAPPRTLRATKRRATIRAFLAII
jgi:hypothetical protein